MQSGGDDRPLESVADAAARLWRPVPDGPGHRITIRVDRGRALTAVWRVSPGLLFPVVFSAATRRGTFLPAVAFLLLFLVASVVSAVRQPVMITFDDEGFQARRGARHRWAELNLIRVLERRTASGGLRGIQQVQLLGRSPAGDPSDHQILGFVDPNLMSLPADVLIQMLLEHHRIPVEQHCASAFNVRIGGSTRGSSRAEKVVLSGLGLMSLLVVLSGLLTAAAGRVAPGLSAIAVGAAMATYCIRTARKVGKSEHPITIGGQTTAGRCLEWAVLLVLGLIGLGLTVLGLAGVATGYPGPGMVVVVLGVGIASFCALAIRRRARAPVLVPESLRHIRV